MRSKRLLTCWTLCLVTLVAIRAAAATEHATVDLATRDQARGILHASGVTGGLVVDLGCGDGKRTAALHAGGSYVVQGLDADGRNVEKARATICAAGEYGPVSVAHWFDPSRLPYADNLVNLIVVEPGAYKGTDEELLRAVAPGGAAVFLSRQPTTVTRKLDKPWPKEIDDWTHFLHAPDNNAVANDSRVGPPRQLQWRGGILWGRDHAAAPSMTSLVSDRGRVFAIMDYGPTTSISLPARWELVARDAFNGVELWRRPLGTKWITGRFRGSPPVFARRLVAVSGKVYVTPGRGAGVVELDGATGKALRTFAGTEGTDEILVDGDRMFLVIVNQGKEGLSAVDLETSKTQWRVPVPTAPLSLTESDGKVFAIDRSTNELCAWDARTGRLCWKVATLPKDARAAFIFGAVVVAKDGVVLAGVDSGAARFGKRPAGSDQRKLLAFDVGSGRKLWEAPFGRGFQTSADILVIRGVVWHTTEEQIQDWANPGRSFNEGRDLKTGRVVKMVPTKDIFLLNLGVPHARCYRAKASSNYVFAGRDGVETIDVKSGHIQIDRWVRGVCQYGLMPANGLLYAPPHACSCYPAAKLHGFLALTSAPAAAPDPNLRRLAKGPAYGSSARKDKSDSHSWCTYRGDMARHGHYQGVIQPVLQLDWKADLGGELTQGVCAAGKLFVPRTDSNQLVCLDALSGKERWRFTADAMIDSPPTYYAGGLLFGCRDGRVYRVRAEDGTLEWTFLAAPSERLICGEGHVESAWPVPGAVLVLNGKVHVVAGRSSFLAGGLSYVQLDAVSGAPVRRRTVLDRDPLTPFGNNRWDMEGSLNDVLSSDGKSFFMRQRQFDLDGVPEEESQPHLFSPAGFLDSSMHHRFFWVYAARYGAGVSAAKSAAQNPSGRILCCDDKQLYGFRTQIFSFGRSKGARKNGRVLYGQALHARKGQENWKTPIPFSPNALVLADNALFVAGPNGNIEESMKAFNGQSGSSLWAVDPKTGARVSTQPLESMPTFDGMIAAYGRLYIATVDGKVLCYGDAK